MPGVGEVPVFEDRDGVYTAVGYRPWDCLERQTRWDSLWTVFRAKRTHEQH